MLGLFKKQHKRRDPSLRPWEEGGSRIKVGWGQAWHAGQGDTPGWGSCTEAANGRAETC